MPALVDRRRHQTAVLWAASGTDEFAENKVDAAVELDPDKQTGVRWETGNKDWVNNRGVTVAIDSTVVVDRAIPVGSIMWLGKLVDLASPPVDLRVVVDYQETPNIKNRNIRRTVLLEKHSDTLPTVNP